MSAPGKFNPQEFARGVWDETRFTPAQVSALSDRDLGIVVAREVFGGLWFGVNEATGTYRPVYTVSGECVAIFPPRGRVDLSPASADAVELVMDGLRARWIAQHAEGKPLVDWSIHGFGQAGWFAQVGSVPQAEDPPVMVAFRRHENRRRAILECAVLAAQETRS